MENLNVKNYGQVRWTDEGRVFTKAFTWTGVSFALICFIGFMVNIIVDSGGLLKGLADVDSFDWSMYEQIAASGAIATLAKVSVFAMILVSVSYIIRIVWIFRIFTVSKTFIYVNYALYIVAQGLGFGLLFTIWKSSDILIVFGVAGFLFGAMAFAGYRAKSIDKAIHFVIAGFVAMFVMMIMSMILYFSGIYSSALIFVYFLVAGALILAYIAIDVYILKSYARNMNFYGNSDGEFRIIAFMGFRLLTDLVMLIWYLIRILGIIKKD